MQAAVDVGVFVRVGVLDGVEHGLRLLRRRAVVEIDERLAVDFTRQDREVAADRLDVVGSGGDYLIHVSDLAVRPQGLPRLQAISPARC